MDRNSIPYSDELHWRFSSFVDFGSFQECWIWKGAKATAKHSPQYKWGVMSIKDRAFKASRVSWMLNIGPIPDGVNVLHTCDNPLCVCPGHLFLGTQKENVRDMDRKGRRVNAPLTGKRHANSKLTDEQVELARSHVGPARIMAARLGITPEQVNNIRRGRQRKEIKS